MTGLPMLFTALIVAPFWGSGFIKSRNRQAVTHYREESDSEKNRFSKNTKDSKEDLFQQFKQAQSIGSPISMSQRSTPDLHTIKSQSLSYLMMLLFGEGSLMRDSFRNSTAGFPPAFRRTSLAAAITQNLPIRQKRKRRRFLQRER